MPSQTDSANRSQRIQTGQYRAFSTIVLLTLHRRGVRVGHMGGEIGDAGGYAGQELMARARIPGRVTPQGLSTTLHRLRAEGIIDSDTNHMRTYSIWLTGRLSAETIEALEKQEAWARAFIEKRPLPELNCTPPEIVFANEEDEYIEPDDEDESVTLDAMEAEMAASQDKPAAPKPNQVLGVSPDVAMLMRIISDQAETIKSLLVEMGRSPDEYRPSSETIDFLMKMVG